MVAVRGTAYPSNGWTWTAARRPQQPSRLIFSPSEQAEAALRRAVRAGRRGLDSEIYPSAVGGEPKGKGFLSDAVVPPRPGWRLHDAQAVLAWGVPPRLHSTR